MNEATSLSASELRDLWAILTPAERVDAFRRIDRSEAHDFFLRLSPLEQAGMLAEMPPSERFLWIRILPPDDAANVLRVAPAETRDELLGLLDDTARREIMALLAYKDDVAGGRMSPRFSRLRPEMTVDEAIPYLRRQAQEQVETIYYAYVLDAEGHLLGVVSFRDLLTSRGDRLLSDVMNTRLLTVSEDMDQEAVAAVIAQHDLQAVPVVDADGVMKGIVTVDDIVDIVQAEATEDIQKLGGMEALETPYWETGFLGMIRKRAGWLSALFLGEMLTTNAMSRYEGAIENAIVLALFVPLIISSGGNSGAQASTLIIRAMALREVALRDWRRIVRRELAAGLALGGLLAILGLVRILIWHEFYRPYGSHYPGIALVVALSLVGVVTWGTLTGSMLPFIIRRFGFDPASASAPFVATLVDVFGIVIYFSVAQAILNGSLN